MFGGRVITGVFAREEDGDVVEGGALLRARGPALEKQVVELTWTRTWAREVTRVVVVVVARAAVLDHLGNKAEVQL